jgi:hypothetical protein
MSRVADQLPLKNWKKNKEELVTLLAEESLMGLLVNLGSVCHSRAYSDPSFRRRTRTDEFFPRT